MATSIVTFIAGMHARKQLGGMSGDIAGYSIIWGEFAGVLAAAISTAY
jgi:cobalamin synthase